MSSSLKRGPLLKMIEAMSAGDRRVKWSHLLQYIDSNVIEDPDLDNVKLPIESPLPAFCVSNDELRAELAYDKKTGDSILRKAVLGGAPARIVAALCHLGPEALACPDHKGRVLLHLACLLSPTAERTNEVLTILVKSHPAALLARDQGGRSPLHYLCWFHAPLRNAEIVAVFCTKLPKTKFYGLKQAVDADKKHPLPEIPRPQARIPNSAAILPDGKHGCLALHYAVANQCSAEVLQVLLQVFPLSKHMTDRYGRTPLHWYLGAGHAAPSGGNGDSNCGNASTTTTITHVSGEVPNPHEAPWYHRPLDPTILTLLLSSRVARTTDYQGRHVLHWGAHRAAMALYHYHKANASANHAVAAASASPTADTKDAPPSVPPQFTSADMKMIRSHFTGQIVGQDSEGQTPIMIFFDTIQACQGKHGMQTVEPNMEVLRLLLQHPDESEKHVPAAVEDVTGRLPLHAAVEIASGPAVVSLILEQHPAALVHTSESYQAPLHAAFAQERAAPWQTTQILQVLLQTYTAGSHETVVVDGRMALKLEDAAGTFPIHYAAENQAILPVLQLLVRSYPPISLQQRSDGNLAIHCLMRPSMIQYLTSPLPQEEETHLHSEEDFLVDRRKLQVFFPFILQNQGKLHVAGSVSKMLPLHIAVLFQVIDSFSLLRILRAFPEAAKCFTSGPEFSILDLHESVKPRWLSTMGDWHHVRELLFSFVPTLGSHRHRQELLDRCVQIVIDEVNQEGDRDHLRITNELENQERATQIQPLQLSHSLSAAEAKTRTKLKIRAPPKKKKKKAKESVGTGPPAHKQKSRLNKAVMAVMSGESTQADASMYDEDGTGLKYDVISGSLSVSDVDTDDEDDSYFSGEAATTDGEIDDEDDEDYTDDEVDDEGEEIVLGDSTCTEDDGFQTDSNSLLTRPSASASFSMSGPSTSYGDGSTTLGGSANLTHGSSTLRGSGSMGSLKQAPSLVRTSQGLVMPLPASLDAFDRAQKAMDDEKKEDDGESEKFVSRNDLKTRRAHELKPAADDRPAFLSDVGMRLWTFFAMFSDDNNPSDNYVDQISAIFDEVPFAHVEKLVRLPLPSYAKLYVSKDFDGVDLDIATFRDVANPKCRELIHKTCYFVGKYDFASHGSDLLVHRQPNGRSFMVRAYEWHFTTEEETEAINPGISEATIWKTGEIPAEIGLTFRSHKRPVLVKFTKDPDEFQDEVSCRLALGENEALLPLLSSYSADAPNTKNNRTYRTDINDVRFNRLDLGHGNIACLEKFPYSLVYAESSPLVDFYRQRGFDSDRERKEVCTDIAKALEQLHTRDIVHGGLSLSKIVRCNVGQSRERWVLSDCVGSTVLNGNAYTGVGRVSRKGNLLTNPVSAPPELMEKASPAQLRHYRKYWSAVKKAWGIEIGKEIVEPYADPTTGETFFFRYYFGAPEGDTTILPGLPYSILPTTTATDMWAFGLLVFELYAGRPLIPYDERSGAILDCSVLAKWDNVKATTLIYNCVKNPLAQDLLLMLLGTEEVRLSLCMTDILNHPLFLPEGTSSQKVSSILEKRRMDTAAHKRLLQHRLEESSVKDWRESRSISLVCWDTSILEKFLLTPTDIMKELLPREVSISFPCTYLLLPYKLMRNEFGLLSPQKLDDLVMVETLGANLLALGKVCKYSCLLAKEIQGRPAQKKWSSTEFFSLIKDNYFSDVEQDVSALANKYIESFRNEPMTIVKKLIHERILDVLSLYADDDSNSYLYLVDEFRCLPISESPIVISPHDERRSEVILCSLLSMQLTVLYAMHKHPGGHGLLQLLNESGAGHIPALWADTLPIHIRRSLFPQDSLESITEELHVLQDAFSTLEGSYRDNGKSQRHSLHPDGDLRVLRHLVEDRLSDWGDLYRTTVPGEGDEECCLWTDSRTAESLRQRSSQSSWKTWIAQQSRFGTPPPSPRRNPKAGRSSSRSPSPHVRPSPDSQQLTFSFD